MTPQTPSRNLDTLPIDRAAIAVTAHNFRRKYTAVEHILIGSCPLHGYTYTGSCSIEIDLKTNSFKTTGSSCKKTGKPINLISLFVFKQDEPNWSSRDDDSGVIKVYLESLPKLESMDAGSLAYYFVHEAARLFEASFPEDLTDWIRDRFWKAAQWFTDQDAAQQPPTGNASGSDTSLKVPMSEFLPDATKSPPKTKTSILPKHTASNPPPKKKVQTSPATIAMVDMFLKIHPEVAEAIEDFFEELHDPVAYAKAIGEALIILAKQIVTTRT